MKSVQIQWGPIQCVDCETCICSALVQYRKTSESTFTTPSQGNPTQLTEYTLSQIEEGVVYEVLITFIGPQCKSKQVKIPLYLPKNACCPEGFTLNANGTQCFKITDIAATPPSGTPATLINKNNAAYSSCGSYIYQPGYNLNGTGAATMIPVIVDVPSGQPSTLWTNGDGNCLLGDGFSNLGPLNRTGVWTTVATNNQDVGFSFCFEAPETKTYYIAMGSDNYGIITVDGVDVVDQNAVALGTQYGVGPAAAFKVWHIYPVEFSAGPHVVNIRGHNVDSQATIGCEIYNATADQLRACTNVTMLQPLTLFSSQNRIGQQTQIGTGGTGFTCPDDYVLAACTDGPAVCRNIEYTDPIIC